MGFPSKKNTTFWWIISAKNPTKLKKTSGLQRIWASDEPSKIKAWDNDMLVPGPLQLVKGHFYTSTKKHASKPHRDIAPNVKRMRDNTLDLNVLSFICICFPKNLQINPSGRSNGSQNKKTNFSVFDGYNGWSPSLKLTAKAPPCK